MTKKVLLSVFILILFSVSVISISAQGPTGAGVTPTKVNPSTTPTPSPTLTPTAASMPKKSDEQKVWELTQILASDKSTPEKLLAILMAANDGKIADVDLQKTVNDWAVETLTGLRFVVVGWMFRDFTTDNPFNKVRNAFSVILFGFLSIIVVWRGFKIIIDINRQRLNFVLELSFFLGVGFFAIYLLGLPALLGLLMDSLKSLTWALAQGAGQTLNPGQDPFTVLVDNVLSLFNQTTSLTPDKLILMTLLPGLVFLLTMFLMGAVLWFLFLATFGQGGIALSLFSGSRALTGSFRIIASTIIAALQIFTAAAGILMLIILATSPNMKQMSLWVFTLGIPIVLVIVFAINSFIAFVLARPIEKRLAELEEQIAARTSDESGATDSAMILDDGLSGEWNLEEEA